ncbi:MAG: hypothetical protein GKR98_08310 [Boseongicola sp.]|nr:MAG: hypothetical protein GKR98_08310 [Boseongicola sp.]
MVKAWWPGNGTLYRVGIASVCISLTGIILRGFICPNDGGRYDVFKSNWCGWIIAGLSACSSPTFGPVSTNHGSDLSGLTITDNGDGTFTFSDGGTPISTVVSYNSNVGGFVIGVAPTGGDLIHSAQTPSNAGSMLLFVSQSFDVDGVRLERVGETVLPGGSATFTGHFALQNYLTANRAPTGAVEGDITLVVDFGAGTVAGGMSNATGFATDTDYSHFEVSFEETSIVNGGFSGATVANGDNQAGTYDGLFVGANGEEAIGHFTYLRSSGTDRRRGIFWAESP